MPGPYVQLATLCEKVLQEADGVLSIIRVIDRIIVTAQGSEVPTELPQSNLEFTLVVTLKSDDARGRHPVSLRIQQPSGAYLPERTFDVMFEGEERGVNLILRLQLEAVEGLYWFDVAVNQQLLTRVPLRVMYQRLPTGP
ncbi:MAG: DUF6941 family protein [Acidimicrobiia bacterium]